MQQPASAQHAATTVEHIEKGMRLNFEQRSIKGRRPKGTRDLIVRFGSRNQNGTSERPPVPRDALRSAIRRAYSIRFDFGVA